MNSVRVRRVFYWVYWIILYKKRSNKKKENWRGNAIGLDWIIFFSL